MPPFLRYLMLGVAVLACSALHWRARAEDGRDRPCGARSRCLVIDAQDAGMAAAVDRATFAAVDHGTLTSAGVLVPAPWFPEVVRWSRAHPSFDFGVQLDLNAEWASFRWPPVSAQPPGSGLRDPAGYLPNDARYIAQHANPAEVAAEFRYSISGSSPSQWSL